MPLYWYYEIMELQRQVIEPTKGRLLVAQPFLGDPSFDRSIVLLTEHNEEGSVGFVVNKPMDLYTSDVIKDFPSYAAPLYYGGPVQRDRVFFIHTLGFLPGCIEFRKGFYWGGDIEVIKKLIDEKEITVNDLRFFLGYSGWGKGQLQFELEEHSWVVIEDNVIDVMHIDPDTMWKEALMHIGGSFKLWANTPKDPLLN